MAGLSAAAALMPPDAASALDGQVAEDPIFAILAAYKGALAERIAYLDSDHIEEAHAADLSDREFEAFHKLFTTAPTTVAGLAALIEQLAVDPYDPHNDKVRLSRSLRWPLRWTANAPAPRWLLWRQRCGGSRPHKCRTASPSPALVRGWIV
jgi:hypothetical protein